MVCSVLDGVEIVKGGRGDYDRLSRFHYRDGRLGVYAAIYAMRPCVGVIVYSMPLMGCSLRRKGCGGIFEGYDRVTRLKLINANVRRISRVIIEPRYRSLGLASRLVRETMGLMGVRFVESMAVMGSVNGFFVRAGMREYGSPEKLRCVRLREAFSYVGIEGRDLIDGEVVEEKLCRLSGGERGFIEGEIGRFLQSYGKRRGMGAGLERSRYLLSKLTVSPRYYLWENEGVKFRV